MSARTNRELSRRWTVYLRRGVVASAAIHVALVLLFRSGDAPLSPFSAAGPRGDDDAAAAGGGMQLVAVRPPPPDPIQPVPVPLPEVTIEDVLEPADVPEPPSLEVELPGESLGAGTVSVGDAFSPGLMDGTGRGAGGTAEEGRFRVVPPSPRGLILPPSDRPRDLRGRDVTVWVYVAETGRVVPDSTRLDPGTGNARFDRRLRDQAAEWLFEPARRAGEAVPEWYSYVITL